MKKIFFITVIAFLTACAGGTSTREVRSEGKIIGISKDTITVKEKRNVTFISTENKDLLRQVKKGDKITIIGLETRISDGDSSFTGSGVILKNGQRFAVGG